MLPGIEGVNNAIMHPKEPVLFLATPKGAYLLNLEESGDLSRTTVKLLADGSMSCIELSKDGRYIACGGKDKIVLIDTEKNKHFWSFE